MNIDLTLTESQEMLRQSAQDFMRRDAPKEVVQALLNTETGTNPELWRKMAEAGWLGIVTPEKYGGSGESLTSAGALFEVLGMGPLPGPMFSSGVLGTLVVQEAGSEEQKRLVLPDVVSGKRILGLALTEPEFNWEPDGIRTSAAAGNGGFVLKGRKLFVADGGAATDFLVAARLDGGAGEKAVCLFVVGSKAKGVAVRQVPGFLSGRSFEVVLDSVEIGRSDLLGAGEGGWAALQRAVQKAIPILCAYKAGGCQALVELALVYSRTRVQFGNAIGKYQRVQDMIIRMVTHADSARLAAYEALWKLDTGRPAAESVHMAKAVAGEAYWAACTLAHQVFSGISYSKEHPVSFHIRASRSMYGHLGDPSYHRLKLARLVAGLQ